jgi:sulfatase maturation enzyme AslB (radical SAM superfamily)
MSNLLHEYDTLDLLDGSVFQVTWDLGRRCNYDCSYCPVHRHDNHSPHATLEELKKNADFVFKYISLYMKYRNYKEASISFTGGEPTVNPNFIPFIKYLNETYQAKYKDEYVCTFALTSNGAMSEKMADAIVEHFSHITISYHTEADDTLKNQALARIEQIYKTGPAKYCTVSINVMFHAQYFDECIRVCEELDSKGVNYVPRVIGEEPDSRPSFAHKYSDEQLQWMKDYWDRKNKKVQEKNV